MTHSANGLCVTFLFLPHFDFVCDLLLNRDMATWNLFIKQTILHRGSTEKVWNGVHFLLDVLMLLLQLVPGETALAFYTATNPTDEPITGISTYNVIPFEAGQYFNKIQVSHLVME